MPAIYNPASRALVRTLFRVMTRVEVVRSAPELTPPYLLAVTHLSHYDPFCVSVLYPPKIDWMAREEFFRTRLASWFMQHTDSFRISRFGYARPGLRIALDRLADGRIVGIFPEGEVSRDHESALRGARLKQGVGFVAHRARVPILPCVIVGSHQFQNPLTWFPFRIGHLRIIFGKPIEPDFDLPLGRESRARTTAEVEQAFQGLYRELKSAGTPEEAFPRAAARAL